MTRSAVLNCPVRIVTMENDLPSTRLPFLPARRARGVLRADAALMPQPYRVWLLLLESPRETSEGGIFLTLPETPAAETPRIAPDLYYEQKEREEAAKSPGMT
jgi:hypothetical protein